MKNKIKLILICIIIILIAIVGNVYHKKRYSIEYFIEMLEMDNNSIYNMLVEDKTFVDNDNESEYSSVSYMENNIIHTIQYNGKKAIIELIYDYNNLELITISHEEKKIRKSLLNEGDKDLYYLKNINSECAKILKEINQNNNLEEFEFKYQGKEKVNGKNTFKISIGRESEFYIDCKNKNVIMYKQNFEKGKLKNIITYSYNTIIDNDIEFDINNYPNYEVLDNE